MFGGGDTVAHLDCCRPCDLSLEERLLLLRYCGDHVVAECATGCHSFRPNELIDLIGNRTRPCRSCGADLTQAIRAHLYDCEALPAKLRSRARELREAMQNLLKQSQEAVDCADVLLREAEAAIRAKNRLLLEVKAARVALHQTMQRLARLAHGNATGERLSVAASGRPARSRPFASPSAAGMSARPRRGSLRPGRRGSRSRAR